ncbi:hypothetical protein [Flavobacterium sp. ZT3R18]|uniref:hypothetical protein n=1 Tax=Flavobacterium sp. ZT3R18 TaxID=2594429 RepID=UPI00163DB631|nr:hypothetical protein [Flavobacterium sp. ZT3R18]
MRATVFFVYLCFHLLGGGHYLHADTNHDSSSYSSSYNFSKNLKVKFLNQDQGSLLIEDADVDLDEEHVSGDDAKDGLTNKFLFKKYSLLDSWYLAFPNQFVLNDYSECFKIFLPFCGHSNPIYIRQRVLRI